MAPKCSKNGLFVKVPGHKTITATIVGETKVCLGTLKVIYELYLMVEGMHVGVFTFFVVPLIIRFRKTIQKKLKTSPSRSLI